MAYILSYETDGRPAEHQSRIKGASLVRVLVRVVQFTRYTFIALPPEMGNERRRDE